MTEKTTNSYKNDQIKSIAIGVACLGLVAWKTRSFPFYFTGIIPYRIAMGLFKKYATLPPHHLGDKPSAQDLFACYKKVVKMDDGYTEKSLQVLFEKIGNNDDAFLKLVAKEPIKISSKILTWKGLKESESKAMAGYAEVAPESEVWKRIRPLLHSTSRTLGNISSILLKAVNLGSSQEAPVGTWQAIGTVHLLFEAGEHLAGLLGATTGFFGGYFPSWLAKASTAALVVGGIKTMQKLAAAHTPPPAGFTNKSQDARNGDIETLYIGWDNIWEKVAPYVDSKKKGRRKAVVLVGPPGVGKSQWINQLAARSGYEVISTVTVRLNDHGVETDQYKTTTEDLIRYCRESNKKKIIVNLEEFHSITKPDHHGQQALPEYFKELVNLGISVIATTTDEQYQELERYKDQAFHSRIHKVVIKPMDESTCKLLVTQLLRANYPYIRLTDFDTLYQKTTKQGYENPGNISEKVLEKAEALKRKLPNRQAEIARLESRLETARQELRADPSREKLAEKMGRYSTQLKGLRESQPTEKEQRFSEWKQLLAERNRWEEKRFAAARSGDKKAFGFIHMYALPAMEEQLNKKAEELKNAELTVTI